MTINQLFTYLILGSLFLFAIGISFFLFLSKKERNKKNLLLKSISSWITLISLLTTVISTSYYQIGYQYKKSNLPVSYLTKNKAGFPTDKFVTTDMPNIPNTTPYGIVVFYDNSKESQKAVKEINKLFYESGDIPKAYLLSDGFTPAISFVNINSELGKTYKSSIGKNVAEIVTVFTEGEQAGYADKTQLANLTAPSLIFYTSTGQLVSATKMTDVDNKYQKIVAENAKNLYQEILAMNSSLSNNTSESSEDTTTQSTETNQ